MKRTVNRVCRTQIPIAFIIHSMRVGGAERSVARLVNALDVDRFKPMVICLTHSGPAAQWIESPDVPIVEIKKDKRTDFHAVLRLANVLCENRIALIHSYNWGTLLESTLARSYAKVEAHVHAERGTVLGQVEFFGIRMRMRGMLAGWAMRRCNAVVTNSKSVTQRIHERCGFPADRVRVIPNGVEALQVSDRSLTTTLRHTLGINESATILGSVGRLAAVKGFEIAIKALAGLCSEGRDCHLVLVGDGPEKSALQTMASTLNVGERVHLVGHQSQVADWLSVMDIYLNTSHSEGMSQSLVEAMSVGLPAIVTNVGDSSLVVGANSEFGLLIEAGNVHGLVNSITKLSDIGLRAHYARSAQQRHADEFSLGAMASQYQSLYEASLREHYRMPKEPIGLR